MTRTRSAVLSVTLLAGLLGGAGAPAAAGRAAVGVDGRPVHGAAPGGIGRCARTEACHVTTDPPERSSGLFSNGTATEAVTPALAAGASYVQGGNVLRLPSGRWQYLPAGATRSVVVDAGDAGALAQIAASRAWLASGRVPGAPGVRREGAERALLSMRALLRPNGAFAAAWYPFWDFSWPRDSSFAAAAFAHTGHDEEAYRILGHNARTQRADGTWEARTRLDASGPPDARPWQLDANGWVPWAAWQWYRTAPEAGRTARLEALYPMLRKAADYAAGSLDAEGCRPPRPTTGNCPPPRPTSAPPPRCWPASTPPPTSPATSGAPPTPRGGRTPRGGSPRASRPGSHRSATSAPSTACTAATARPPSWRPLQHRSRRPARGPRRHLRGAAAAQRGLVPGDDPETRWGDITWTACTSFFALAWSGLGEEQKAGEVVDWVLSRRNVLGELPETVTADGRPKAVVPLGWTDAIVLMALLGTDGAPLPVPPPPRP